MFVPLTTPTACRRPCLRWSWALAAVLLLALTGCHAIDFAATDQTPPGVAEPEPPRELAMVSLPAYRLEPPDIIRIDVVRLVPRAPYRIELFDVLQIHASGTLVQQPINEYYLVDADGLVNLGPTYGVVHVAGLTMEQAAEKITRALQEILQNPVATVQLARSASAQQVAGIYQLGSDGTITLPHCGTVRLIGLTVTEAREAVQRQLTQYFEFPQVMLDVAQFNSLRYFIVISGTGGGDDIRRVPITGNETVLDAIAQVNGLPRISSKTMWLARPTPGGIDAEQILPIHYDAITRGADTETNYQILPGDRIYIMDDAAIGFSSYLARLTSPVERLLGITDLSASVTRSLQTQGRDYNRTRRTSQ